MHRAAGLRRRKPVFKPQALLAHTLNNVAALAELAHHFINLAAVALHLCRRLLLQRLDMALEAQRALAILQRQLLHVVVLCAPVHYEIILALVLGAQLVFFAGENLEQGLELHDAAPQRADVFRGGGVEGVVC